MNKLIFKLFYGTSVLFLILVAAALLSGCGITGKAAAQAPSETGRNPEVYFCPREDCGKILEGYINSANFSAHCALYDVDLKKVISALARKSRDADVKIVMDESNYEGQIKGEAVRLDTDEQLMHNKFCIIDQGIVITGSFNPTDNDNNYNNNNIVIFYSKILAKNYEDEFQELWNREFGRGSRVDYPKAYINGIEVENYFCPEDNCASTVIGLINNAESSAYFMAFAFTNGDIADALIENDNLEIRGIFDAQQSSNRYSQLKRLKEFGINAKKDTGKYKMHHKVFIIDNETVATGSFNPTLSADTKNDENLLIIHDKKIANAFLNEFELLWNQ